jgi:hypothetical protein
MKRLSLVFLAALLAMALPPADAAAADLATRDWIPGLARSGDLGGPVLAQGNLQTRTGNPVSGRVLLVAWPVSATLAALEIGDAFHTLPVAQTSVGSDGRFALRIDPAVPLHEYTEPDGTINFELYADTNQGRAAYNFARKSVGGAWVEPAGAAAARIAVTVDLALGRSERADPTTTVPSGAAPPENKDYGCPNYVVARYNGRWTAIGETYPGPSATAEFIYTQGASSTLGVGISVSGDYGSYSASGTTTQSSTTEINWPIKPANSKWFYWTTFQYTKFDVQMPSDYYCYHWAYRVSPTRFDGGVSSASISSAPTANNCSPIGGPVTIHKTQGTAVTWTNGVQIKSVIGIDLSSKTGFNANTKYTFRFTRAGRLCGSNSTYPNAAQVVGKGP